MTDPSPHERLTVDAPADWGGSSGPYLDWYGSMSHVESFFEYEIVQAADHHRRLMRSALDACAADPAHATQAEFAEASAVVEAEAGLNLREHHYMVRYATLHMAVTALDVYLYTISPALPVQLENRDGASLTKFVAHFTRTLELGSSNAVYCAIAVRNKLSHQDGHLTGRSLPPGIDLEAYCGTDTFGQLRITDDLIRRALSDLRQFVHAIESALADSIPEVEAP